VNGDHSLLAQMITNLVENAIKYSAPVTQPRVEISVGRRIMVGEPLVWLRVSDNGIGIKPNDLEHIFNRFYQVEASRTKNETTEGDTAQTESSGTGLGLAIAQWIAKAHGGEIQVESTAGRGSIFEVTLPDALKN
jgi:signal transduction histidine kinase